MSRNSINTNNLRHNTAVLEKESLKLLNIALLRPYSGKNTASMGHT